MSICDYSVLQHVVSQVAVAFICCYGHVRLSSTQASVIQPTSQNIWADAGSGRSSVLQVFVYRPTQLQRQWQAGLNRARHVNFQPPVRPLLSTSSSALHILSSFSAATNPTNAVGLIWGRFRSQSRGRTWASYGCSVALNPLNQSLTESKQPPCTILLRATQLC